MNVNKVGNLRYDFIIAFILSTITITRYYTGFIPGIRLSEILLFIVILLVLLKKSLTISKKQIKIVLLVMAAILTTFLSLLEQRDLVDIIVFTRILRSLLTIFIIVFILRYVNRDVLIKVYKYVVVFTIVYLLFQIIFFRIGVHLPIKILPINFYNEEVIYNPYTAAFFRPAAFFAEPSHLAQFLLPGIIFSIFGWYKNRKNDLLMLGIIGLAIFLSSSTLGIFSGIILFIVSIFLKYRKKRLFSISIIMISIITVSTLLIFSNNEIIQYTIKKINVFDTNSVSSDGLRIYRGWAIYAQLPLKYKIMGIGHGNLGNFVVSNGITTRFDPVIFTQYDYASGISLLFLYYGIGFAILFLYIMYEKFRNSNQTNKSLIITYLILLFATGAIFGTIEILYFSFIFAHNGIVHKDFNVSI